MIDRNINWYHSDATPVRVWMGQEPFPAVILMELDKAIGCNKGDSATAYITLIKQFDDQLFNLCPDDVSLMDIWNLKESFIEVIKEAYGESIVNGAMQVIRKYLAFNEDRLDGSETEGKVERWQTSPHLNTWTRVECLPGKVAQVAAFGRLGISMREGYNPSWRKGICRLIFLSSIGDPFTRTVDFDFLKNDIIQAIASKEGKRHFWLCLTRFPQRMAEFSEHIGGLPENICAMTKITGPKDIHRIDELRRVKAAVRGLYIDPLRQRLPIEQLDLKGISWVVLGGDYQYRNEARPFQLTWASEILKACRSQGVAFMLTQLGCAPILDGSPLILEEPTGSNWYEWPEELRVREYPTEILDYGDSAVARSRQISVENFNQGGI